MYTLKILLTQGLKETQVPEVTKERGDLQVLVVRKPRSLPRLTSFGNVSNKAYLSVKVINIANPTTVGIKYGII